MDPTAQHLVTLWHAAQSAAHDALLELNVGPSTTGADVIHVMAPPAPPAAAVVKPKPPAMPVRAPAAPVARPATFELSPVAVLVLFAIAAIILIALWGCGPEAVRVRDEAATARARSHFSFPSITSPLSSSENSPPFVRLLPIA